MSDFYPPEATELSRAVLADIRDLVPDSVLIGGWATWLRLRQAMSHDVDLIVEHADLEVLRRNLDDLSQSGHIRGTKHRGSYRGIHIDIYVPYQSRLGQRLQLRAEDLLGEVETMDGLRVLVAPAHIATKFAALLDRPDSLPGRKDRHEILGLLSTIEDSESVARVIRAASDADPDRLHQMIEEGFDYLIEHEVGGRGIGRKERHRLRRIERRWHAELAGDNQA